MHRTRLFASALLVCALRICPAAEPLLEQDVLPILRKHCMGCHGGLKQEGKLDLRTLPGLLRGGVSGPAVVAGQPDQSPLWKLVASGEMPQEKSPLPQRDQETLRAWIAGGLPTFAARHGKLNDPLLPRGGRHEPVQVAQVIDRHIESLLDTQSLQPERLADDAEFLRRVCLDLTGRVPRPEQAANFLDDKAQDKREQLIDRLLATPEFGQQFGRTWRDWICPPELPSDMNSGRQPIQESRALGDWLSKRFADGETWDRIVRDILSVKGEIKTNPQMIFFGLVGQDAKVTPDGSTRSVASLFMGVQLQCAQCHDDPYRDWAQSDFWSLAAFFGNVKGDFKKIDEQPGEGRITIPRSAFRNAGNRVSIGFLQGAKPEATQKKTWRPVFLDWLTSKDNPFFARAFANRLWFQLFSRGIVNPVDDLRELNPPSHPGLLRLLSNEFADSKFDVKHLVRCVCNSHAYQRSSRPAISKTSLARDRQLQRFGRAPVRVMTADMLLESLKLVYGDPKLDLRAVDQKDGNTSGESAAVGDAYLEFHRKFATNEQDATDFTHGIPQMLTFINHPRLLQGSHALDEFLKTHPQATPQQTVEWLYLATLSRRPTGDESAESVAYVVTTV
ncbi:MAG: DUF1549 domain-containing protein, partial [Planctomycetaceae bacterium]